VGGDRRAVLYAFGLSQLGWLFFALPLTGALALDVRLPLALALCLVPAAGLATVFPLPDGLGGLEVALAGLLAALAAVDLATAGAVVILFWLCSFWFFVGVCGIAASVAAVGVDELSTLPVPTVDPGENDAGAGRDGERSSWGPFCTVSPSSHPPATARPCSCTNRGSYRPRIRSPFPHFYWG